MSLPDHSIIDSITIVDSDGVAKSGAITGTIRLVGGTGIEIIKTQYDELEIALNTTKAAFDDYYVQKYNTVVNGGTYDGMTFSGMPYYVAKVENNSGADGNLFLLGSECSQAGLFQDGRHPGGDPFPEDPESTDPMNNITVTGAGIHVFDMCLPDVDCDDYAELFGYITEVKNAFDLLKDRILDTPTADRFGLFQQYQALVNYWNYMTSSVFVKFSVAYSNNRLVVKTGYTNMSSNDLPVGLTCTVTTAVTHDSESTPNMLLTSNSNTITPHEAVTVENNDPSFSTTSVMPSLSKWEIFNEYRPNGTLPDGSSIEVTLAWTGTHLGGTVTRNKTVRV